MITPNDLQDKTLLSGYKGVGYDRSTKSSKPYHAQVYGGKNNAAGHAWQGPQRATAREAAQDFCDYKNRQPVAPTVPSPLKPAGHVVDVKRDRLPDDPDIRAALGVLRDAKGERDGRQGYIYCIGEVGVSMAVKVGYSTNPEARVPELQTGNPRRLFLMGKIAGTREQEAALHAKYTDQNILQEWFRPTTELLSEFNIFGQEARRAA